MAILRSDFPPRETAPPPCAADLAALALSLRRATDADRDFLQVLFAGFRAEEMAQLAWPQVQKDAFLNDQFRLQHHHFVSYFPDADFWIVERAGRPGDAPSPVGRFYLDRSAPLWHVIDIGFLQESRGQGFGSALLRWAKAEAAATGAKGIDLMVVVGNAGAQSLYRRLGFRAEGAAEGYHQRMLWRPDRE